MARPYVPLYTLHVWRYVAYVCVRGSKAVAEGSTSRSLECTAVTPAELCDTLTTQGCPNEPTHG